MVSDHATREEEAPIEAYLESVRSALINFMRIIISYIAAFESCTILAAVSIAAPSSKRWTPSAVRHE
jgi:hypothetical protein